MAAAADINGKWHAQVPWPGKNLTDFYLNLTVDGAKLTGTVSYAVGDNVVHMEIQDGKVTGDEISFVIVNKIFNIESKWSFKGTVKSGEIPFTVDIPAGPAFGPPPGAPGGGAPGALGAPGAPSVSGATGGAPGAPGSGAPPPGPLMSGPSTMTFTARRGLF
jgi:hypothetical protein